MEVLVHWDNEKAKGGKEGRCEFGFRGGYFPIIMITKVCSGLPCEREVVGRRLKR